MKKVSFVVLSWNSEKYLQDCIESIQKIKGINWELFIVDNGSTDKSKDIVKNYINGQNSTILIQLDKNYGTTVSRNKALSAIKNTDYICILDSDTIINQRAIIYMSDYLESHNDVGIVGPGMKNALGEKQIPYRKFPTWKIKLLKACPIKKISMYGEKIESYDENELLDAIECDYLISACWMLRYDTYKQLGGLDEKIFYAPEDVEYCMRARKNGYRIVHLRNVEIIHHYQRISKKKLVSKTNFTHLVGIIYVLHKYKNFLKEYYKNGEEK